MDKAKVLMAAMRDRMKLQEVSKPKLFEFVREIFGVDAKIQKDILEQVEESIVEGRANWCSKISVTVICAQGLIAKDKNGTSDPYVTVQIGKTKKRTRTVYRDLNPVWNETFHFDCQNFTDRVKVRIWDEDDGIKSKLRQRLTMESDDFLGQVVIDVRTLSAEMDVWYNLDKRTDKSAVSGAIRLLVNMEINGEEKVPPYHVQYTFLHEEIFKHYYEYQSVFELLEMNKECSWNNYFEKEGQEVVSEFATQYGVENVYQLMTHFSCLCTKYQRQNAPAIMSVLLANINAYYAHVTTSNLTISPSQAFSMSNFDSDNFVKLIDQLYESLKTDLSAYRTNYYASSSAKLNDLKSVVDLITSITFFRKKVLEVADVQRAVDVVRNCVTACTKSTYQHFLENCETLYKAERNTVSFTSISTSSSSENSVNFWSQLLCLIAFAVEEDKKVYTAILNQFSQELNVCHLSAITMWSLYSNDMATFLDDHPFYQNASAVDYVNLYFRTKHFHSTYISDIPSLKDTSPDYPQSELNRSFKCRLL